MARDGWQDLSSLGTHNNGTTALIHLCEFKQSFELASIFRLCRRILDRDNALLNQLDQGLV